MKAQTFGKLPILATPPAAPSGKSGRMKYMRSIRNVSRKREEGRVIRAANHSFYIKKTPRIRVRCGVPLMRGESGSDAKCEVGVKCYAYAG